MARDNVEVVRGIVAAWNRRDLNAVLAFSDTDFAYVNAPSAVEAGTREGHGGLSLVLRKQWDALGAAARMEIERMHAQGDQVILASRMSRQMPGSPARLENRVATRWTFRDGRLIRLEVLGAGTAFQTALEAVGLSE